MWLFYDSLLSICKPKNVVHLTFSSKPLSIITVANYVVDFDVVENLIYFESLRFVLKRVHENIERTTSIAYNSSKNNGWNARMPEFLSWDLHSLDK